MAGKQMAVVLQTFVAAAACHVLVPVEIDQIVAAVQRPVEVAQKVIAVVQVAETAAVLVVV